MQEIKAYKTTDGRIFESQEEADSHQETLPSRPKSDVITEIARVQDVIRTHQEMLEPLLEELEKHKVYMNCLSCGGTGGDDVYFIDCWGKQEYSHFKHCNQCDGKGKVEV